MNSCELCQNPTEVIRCDKCRAEAQWAGSDQAAAGETGTLADKRRAKILGQARADLVALPDLIAELALCRTEFDQMEGDGNRKVIGSPSPVRLDAVHATDQREKPGWHGEDPRQPRWSLTWIDRSLPADSDQRRMRLFPTEEAAVDAYYRLTVVQQDRAQFEPWRVFDLYGAVQALASWTRVIDEEMSQPPDLAESPTISSECSVLIEVWDWIQDQQWATELADEVSKMAGEIRRSLGHRPEYRPRCRYCRDVVDPVDTAHRVTSWESCKYGLCRGCGETFAPGPELAALGAVQAPLTLREMSEVTGIPVKTLHRWADVGAIKPDPASTGRPKRYDLAMVQEAARKLGRVAG